MSKKIIVNIVIILSILIIFCFIALIYGMYLKISKNPNNTIYSKDLISLDLKEDEKITSIQVIDQNRLLITIQNPSILKGAIYNIERKKIEEYIDK
tara:strand:- start:72 stop:359 length:288 start_codon:yes stop_codon:yes gene_type:complete